MPSEEEFVAQLDTRKRRGSVPPLEASDDQLKKFDPPKDKPADNAPAPAAPQPPLPPVYPPLEPAR
jgi:outer membrane protein assembly factor BamE